MADGTADGALIIASASLDAGSAYWVAAPWFYRPSGDVLERLEWLTDVLPSFNGGEQRRELRIAPRRSFEFDFVLTEAERRTAENRLTQGQSRIWSVPVWMDSQALPVALGPSEVEIPIDTATRDFRVGGLVGLMTTPSRFEILQIKALTDSLVTLESPLTKAWPAGETTVFPIRHCRMPDRLNLRRFSGDTSYGRLRFECADPCDWPEASESTYRGLPVLGQAPNWTEDPDQGYERMLELLDGGTGLVYSDDQASGPIMVQSHRWMLDGRAQIDAFRRWLYARKGRLSAFWLPTFALDFKVVASIGSSATIIDVEHCAYSQSIDQAINRRDIRIQLNSGTVYYRRITDSAEISESVERLTINAALGASVSPDQIRSVSYMAPVRLDADAVEISWIRWDLAESRAMTRGSRNDV